MGLILSLNNSIHSFNTGKFVLDQYTGAAAAYSLRRLSVNTTNVVRVRRSVDNAEDDFTADEITDGTLTSFVGGQNLCLQSEDINTTWLPNNATPTQSTETTPDGDSTNKYIKLVDDGSTGTGVVIISQTIVVAGNTKYTASVFLKADGISFAALQANGAGVVGDASPIQYFGLSGAGTKGTASAGIDDSTIEAYPNGWYRCSITWTQGVGDTSFGFYIYLANSISSVTVDLDGTSSIFVWGAQVNEGATAGDYAPTTTNVSGYGYVTTWYDQSGNGNDATQATASSQPKIVDAGSLITSNGYTVIQYDGTDDNLTTSLTATGTMLMGGSDGSDFYEVDISGSYSLLANASLTDHPLNESIRVIWSSSLTTAQKTAIESLVTYTDWDFSDVTSFFRYWRDRSKLTDFPLIDTSSGTNFFQAWYGCTSLTSFPLLDVSNGISFVQAWRNCTSLTSFPLLDVSNNTDFSFAWTNCSSLTSFPLLNVSSGTNFSYAWAYCSSLTSFPLLDVSSGTNFTGTWESCSSLTSFPALDLSSGTNFNSAWRVCTSLQDFPANMFDSVTATGFILAFTSTNLSSQSIENIVVSIDTAGQSNGTLDITGGGNATTATAQTAVDNLRGRGWTVTVPDGY